MKADEIQLLLELQRLTRSGERPIVKDVVHRLGMNEKRAAYILEKWTEKGWYNYGVSVLTGWLEERGMCARVRLAMAAGNKRL